MEVRFSTTQSTEIFIYFLNLVIYDFVSDVGLKLCKTI